MRRTVSILAAMALLVPTAAAADTTALQAIVEGVAAEAPAVDASEIELVKSFPFGEPGGPGTRPFFASGTDLAFEGDVVYAAEQASSGNQTGGIHIIDVSDPDVPEQVGFVDCPAQQNDVAVVAPGIVALGYHSLTPNADGERGEHCQNAAPGGVTLFDVSDPAEPVELGTARTHGGGTHTLTVSPDGSFIYGSPGGIANGAGIQWIIDVRDTDLATYPTFQFKSNETGCHDFSFFTQGDDLLGICVGIAESQIWDLADPTKPVVLTSIANPLIDFMHTGVVSEDGNFLVISDEAIVANDCLGGPTGAMFAYDISDPRLPIPLSYFGIDRAHQDAPLNSVNPSGVSPPGTGRANWCTAHLYNFIPGTNIMVASWYSGGVNVIDWGEDFTNPRELAHYRTDGDYAASEVTNYWSAYWHDGQIYANDRVRGLDVLRWTGAPDTDDPEALSAAARRLPATAAGWRSGRFSDVPTPAQQRHIDLRDALRGDLADGLAPFACRLPLLEG
jgi:hypothetical protein